MVAQLSPSTHILRLLDCQGMLRRWFDLITFLLTTKCIVGVNASKKESMLSSKWWATGQIYKSLAAAFAKRTWLNLSRKASSRLAFAKPNRLGDFRTKWQQPLNLFRSDFNHPFLAMLNTKPYVRLCTMTSYCLILLCLITYDDIWSHMIRYDYIYIYIHMSSYVIIYDMKWKDMIRYDKKWKDVIRCDYI